MAEGIPPGREHGFGNRIARWKLPAKKCRSQAASIPRGLGVGEVEQVEYRRDNVDVLHHVLKAFGGEACPSKDKGNMDVFFVEVGAMTMVSMGAQTLAVI